MRRFDPELAIAPTHGCPYFVATLDPRPPAPPGCPDNSFRRDRHAAWLPRLRVDRGHRVDRPSKQPADLHRRTARLPGRSTNSSRRAAWSPRQPADHDHHATQLPRRRADHDHHAARLPRRRADHRSAIDSPPGCPDDAPTSNPRPHLSPVARLEMRSWTRKQLAARLPARRSALGNLFAARLPA